MLSVLRAVKHTNTVHKGFQWSCQHLQTQITEQSTCYMLLWTSTACSVDINKVLLTAEPSQPESTTEYQCLLSTTLIQIYPIKPLQRQNGFPFNRLKLKHSHRLYTHITLSTVRTRLVFVRSLSSSYYWDICDFILIQMGCGR